MKARSIHLIGICGTAMASLAGMLKATGTGCARLRQRCLSANVHVSGIARHCGLQPFSERNLIPAPDVVVVGNAISRGNPELEYLLDQRIPFVSMPEVIHQEFIRGHNSPGDCRDPWQDHHHQHDGVDLRVLPGAIHRFWSAELRKTSAPVLP